MTKLPMKNLEAEQPWLKIKTGPVASRGEDQQENWRFYKYRRRRSRRKRAERELE
jgi:hypothetical protein